MLYIMFVVPALLLLCSFATADDIADIYWNSTNQIFASASDEDPLVVNARIRDRINIFCPSYEAKIPYRLVEFSSVYMVSQYGYDNCLLHEARPVLQCRAPFRRNFITIVLREYTPNPGALEFTPGETYYFISTSDGSLSGIKNRKGGLCSSKNMRFQLTVGEKATPPPTTSTLPTTTSTTESTTRSEVDDFIQNFLTPRRWRSKLGVRPTAARPTPTTPPRRPVAPFDPSNMLSPPFALDDQPRRDPFEYIVQEQQPAQRPRHADYIIEYAATAYDYHRSSSRRSTLAPLCSLFMTLLLLL